MKKLIIFLILMLFLISSVSARSYKSLDFPKKIDFVINLHGEDNAYGQIIGYKNRLYLFSMGIKPGKYTLIINNKCIKSGYAHDSLIVSGDYKHFGFIQIKANYKKKIINATLALDVNCRNINISNSYHLS